MALLVSCSHVTSTYCFCWIYCVNVQIWWDMEFQTGAYASTEYTVPAENRILCVIVQWKSKKTFTFVRICNTCPSRLWISCEWVRILCITPVHRNPPAADSTAALRNAASFTLQGQLHIKHTLLAVAPAILLQAEVQKKMRDTFGWTCGEA